jgi:metal-sulfur cluster biosynthetic enzyme
MSDDGLHTRIAGLLDTVIDPCSAAAGAPAGLVDMGLIRSLEVDERAGGAAVRVVVRVTHPSCFMAALFLAQVQNLLAELPEVAAVDATLDTAFDWTPADMSDGYRERLARHRAAAGMGHQPPAHAAASTTRP